MVPKYIDPFEYFTILNAHVGTFTHASQNSAYELIAEGSLFLFYALHIYVHRPAEVGSLFPPIRLSPLLHFELKGKLRYVNKV
jgi:hypothetical protein